VGALPVSAVRAPRGSVSRTTANYDAVDDRLTDEEAPSGLILHCAGFDEDAGVFRIVNVWDRDAQGQAYLDDKVMSGSTSR